MKIPPKPLLLDGAGAGGAADVADADDRPVGAFLACGRGGGGGRFVCFVVAAAAVVVVVVSCQLFVE